LSVDCTNVFGNLILKKIANVNFLLKSHIQPPKSKQISMQITASIAELKNQKKARVIAILFFTALVALLLFPLMWYQDPPPGQEGVVVNLGMIDVGDGDQNAPEPSSNLPAVEEETPPSEPETAPVEEEVEEEVVEEVEEVVEEPVKKPDPKPEPTKEVIKTDNSEAIALKKKKEAEKRKAEKEAAEAKKKADAKKKAEREAAEAKRKADAEAKRKADAAAKYNDAKNKYSGAFGGDKGKGKGNTGTAGNQGDPNGDPNSQVLEGISTGSGKIGGGLGSRGIKSNPKPSNNFRTPGTVVMKICVGPDGRVIGEPEFTIRGSTNQTSELKRIAAANAKKWKFSTSSVEKQCGTITYDFKVQ